MVDLSKKPTINMLTPIDNIFGGHEGRLGPTIKFLVVALVPAVVYALYLQIFVPLRVFLVVEVLWAARMALIIIGKEKEKKKFYRASKKNQYASAYDMVRISHTHENSIIEYQNGRIALLLAGYTQSYMDDDKFAVDYAAFMDMLNAYDVDVYCHAVVDEFKLQNNSENLRVYSDKVFMRERMELYETQDKFVSENCQLFRFSFLVKGSRYDWKNMIDIIEAIIKSHAGHCFKGLHICDKDEVSDIASRDLGTHISIEEMLRNKYINEEFDGSKVLFYGDEVPEQFSTESHVNDMTTRRISYYEQIGEDKNNDG